MSKSPHLWGNIGTIQPWRHKLLELKEEKKNMTLESWCSPPSAAIRKILRVSAGSDSINRVIKAKVEGFSFSTTKKKPLIKSYHFYYLSFWWTFVESPKFKKVCQIYDEFLWRVFRKNLTFKMRIDNVFFGLQILPYVNQIK